MKVTITLHGKEHDGRQFVFTEPGSLLFGRSAQAHCQIVGDPYVSRHHFLLFINPPEVRLRNLSRTNGTLVDGTLYTQGEDTGVASEAGTLLKLASPKEKPEAILKHGSEIEAGYTKITVAIQADPDCVDCGRQMPDRVPVEEGRDLLCAECRAKRARPGSDARPAPEGVRQKAPKQSGPRPRDPVSGPAQRIIREILRERHPVAIGLPEIPGHRIEGKLAAGGMGMVLVARRDSDNRKVAMKIIRPDRSIGRELKGRFNREIRITKALQHPNIVPLFDFGEAGDNIWFTMEFVEGGRNIEKRIKEADGRLPWSESVTLMLQALEGLAYAHNRGIVHRDLKPPNILLSSTNGREIGKLADFGIAKSLEETGLNGSFLTKPAIAMGTLPFMPPEQARDVRTCKPTADVFSMGATLYLMLTGRLIRDFSKNLNEAIRQVLSESPISILERGVSIPGRLAAVVDKALSIEPQNRYPAAGVFRDALRGAL
jgi:hypothetical protein